MTKFSFPLFLPQMAVGDLVNFQSNVDDLIAVGIITDIEDGLGRLHVKVSPLQKFEYKSSP